MFYRRDRKRWVVQVRNANGRLESRQFIHRDDAAETEARLVRTRQRVRAGLEKIFEPQAFGDFVSAWLVLRRKTNPASTTEGEGGKLRSLWLPKFEKRPMQTIATAEIDSELRGIIASGNSPATRNRHRALLHSLFQSAVRAGVVGANPISAITLLPERKRDAVYWKRLEESDGYIREAFKLGEVYGVLGSILLWAGPRIGEALALQWQDIQWDESKILIRRIIETVSTEVRDRTKGDRGSGDGYELPLFPRVAVVLRDWQTRNPDARPEDFVVHELGRPIGYWQFLRKHKRIMKAAGLTPITPHKMRHTFASNAGKAGFSTREIQGMLGHASITTTEIYTHTDAEHLIEKAKRLGFGSGLKLIPGGVE